MMTAWDRPARLTTPNQSHCSRSLDLPVFFSRRGASLCHVSLFLRSSAPDRALRWPRYLRAPEVEEAQGCVGPVFGVADADPWADPDSRPSDARADIKRGLGQGQPIGRPSDLHRSREPPRTSKRLFDVEARERLGCANED